MGIIKGTLIPIGGNEDKGSEESESTTLEYIEKGILSRVVKESGGPDALIIVIPTASKIPDEVYTNYSEAFSKLNCTNVHKMDIRSREDAENPDYIELMKKADCIMFSGGDQSRIVNFIGGTVLDNIIRDKYRNENFVIAGTSAGAMCMGKDMITGGGKRETFVKGSVLTGSGMGFISKLIIDSHFIRRRRFGRLAEAVALYPNRIGIGLAEDTGLVIKNGANCEVIGSGMMVIFDPRKLEHNNVIRAGKGEPLSVTNMGIHILSGGDKIDIENENIVFYHSFKEVIPS